MARIAGIERERLEVDVAIVGAGPAGLAAALRLAQLAAAGARSLRVAVLEKGASVGAHILSGAVFDPRALDELLPDWRTRGAPLGAPVSVQEFLLLTRTRAWAVPAALHPPALDDTGASVISLGALCRWLGEQAEAAGVELYPGFAADTLLFGAAGEVVGVGVGDKGVGRDRQKRANFAAGVDILARYTLLAEGARGHLGRVAIERFGLDRGRAAQTYGLGLKELWRVAPERHRPGRVVHTVGWPLDARTYGGGFLYHGGERRVAVGLVVGLDYTNPFLDPFAELQRFKSHPALRDTFAGGERLAYGARVVVEGGLQSLPRLAFPGGALIGCDAGTLNVARIKGTHTAMKSGILAAEAAFAALAAGAASDGLAPYDAAFRASWAGRELARARNLRPGFRWGLWPGLAHAALDQLLLRGRAPWTLAHGPADRLRLLPAERARPIDYPPADGRLSFDLMSSVALSNTRHAEDQPVHLELRDAATPVGTNLAHFAGPEARYCPAGVYEFLRVGGTTRLQINAANCLHCKACDVKDPGGNIRWVTPEGGDGPSYADM